MTLREFILNESCDAKKHGEKICPQCGKKFSECECGQAAKDDFEDEERDFEVSISAKDEKTFKAELKKALADLGYEVKLSAKEEGEAAKKHEEVCPKCGKNPCECEC